MGGEIMEYLIEIIEKVSLYAVLWFVIWLVTFFVIDTFFKRSKDWRTGPIIAIFVATIVTITLFVYNQISVEF